MSDGTAGRSSAAVRPASARRRAELLDLLAGLVAVVLLVLSLADRVGTVRLLLALLFAAFVPGRAIVSNWRQLADWSDIGMSVALSLAVLTLLAVGTLWLGQWHPLRLFQLEAVLSLGGLAVAVIRRRVSRQAAG